MSALQAEYFQYVSLFFVWQVPTQNYCIAIMLNKGQSMLSKEFNKYLIFLNILQLASVRTGNTFVPLEDIVHMIGFKFSLMSLPNPSTKVKVPIEMK